jgi:hypothetical protein
MQKIAHIFLILLTLTVLFSCKKDNDNNGVVDYTNMTAADVGNYYFVYVGKYAYGGEGMSDNTLWIGAGLAEIKKNIFNEGKILTGLNHIFELIGNPVMPGPRPPYGDRFIDFIWTTIGMKDADKSKE